MNGDRFKAKLTWLVLVAALVAVNGLAQAAVHSLEIEVSFPQLDLFATETFDENAWTINQVIRERAMKIIAELAEIGNVWGGHEVYADRPDLLSVVMQYSGYQVPMAHPMHFRASVTANPQTGHVYPLEDLFADDRYIQVLSEAVRQQIIEKDVPVFEEFGQIDPDQEFYVTDDALVLYFQIYEIAPYVWGFPEFEISLATIQDIVKPGGPLDLSK